jgi:hypothetical protein
MEDKVFQFRDLEDRSIRVQGEIKQSAALVKVVLL